MSRYHNDKQTAQRLVIALWHPDYKDRCVVESLRELRATGH